MFMGDLWKQKNPELEKEYLVAKKKISHVKQDD